MITSEYICNYLNIKKLLLTGGVGVLFFYPLDSHGGVNLSEVVRHCHRGGLYCKKIYA